MHSSLHCTSFVLYGPGIVQVQVQVQVQVHLFTLIQLQYNNNKE